MTDTAIRFSVKNLYEITEIEFYTIEKVLTDLGGIAIVMKAVVFLIVSFFFKKKWMDSIVEEVGGK